MGPIDKFSPQPCPPSTRGQVYSPAYNLFHLFDLEEAVELPNAGRMAHFAQRFGLDLADSLARDLELRAHFLQRARIAVTQAEAQFQHLALPLVQTRQHVAQFILEQTEARLLRWAFARLVLDEIADVRVFTVADRRLKRYRLLGHFQDRAHPFDRD